MQTSILPSRTLRVGAVASVSVALLLVAGIQPSAFAEKTAAKAKPEGARKKAWKPQGDLDQDFPYVSACISANFPEQNVANKGIAIKLTQDSFVCFDTDLLRMTAGWTGKYLNFNGVAFDGGHGGHPSIAGDQKFGTKNVPGVAASETAFNDTRPEPFGPISTELGRWNGLYVQGDDVILSYTVLGNKVLERPSAIEQDGQVAFVRDFKISEKVKQPFSVLLCDTDGKGQVEKGRRSVIDQGDAQTQVVIADGPKSATLVAVEGRIVLNVAKGTSPGTIRVVLWKGAKADSGKFAAMAEQKPDIIDVTVAGPQRWPETVATKGTLAFDKSPDGSYVVDQLTPPVDNPWKRRVRFGGFDFFADGKRAAVCTWDGDIWVVSGIDDNLENLQWKRFASGGYETLGLKIVDDVIYTSGRDQITRYVDINNDGECDYYENFNNQLTSSSGFHEFVFDLQTDKDGNFYFCKAGPVRGGGRGFGGDNFGTITSHAGSMLKVSKDGSKLEVVATGLRAPNGMSVGPNGELTTGDNEGTWVPTCPLNWIEPGGFYGVETLAHKDPVPEFKQPICWMSHQDIDNSGGGQVWVTSDKWGPFQNQLLHLSYGKCTLYLVMKERLYGHWQGGVVKLPVKFTSSTMRARFNQADGQLYVCGLQGWQTTAAKITGLDRVRYTGKKVYTVADLQIRKNNQVRLTFTEQLDPAYANDAQNFSVKRWNYRRSADYGSGEFSVADPTKQGRDDVAVEKAILSPDGKTVTLQLADLRPVMQQSINFDLKAKDGTEIRQYIQHTVNIVP